MPINPNKLSRGDTILVISPSGKVDRSAVKSACYYLEQQGFHVEMGDHVYAEYFKYAGNHEQRLSDLQWALDHATAKAVFCARGGYGITHLIDQLSWKSFTEHPKWIIGYSDITALHSMLYLKGFNSIHASVLQAMLSNPKEDVEALCNSLQGKTPNITLPAEVNNRIGFAESEILGGNLAMLVNQIGTASELSFDHKVLFLEDVGEHLYHIDRIMLQLKRANKLEKLSGLIVGSFSNMKESSEQFGQTIEEIVLTHCKAYHFPIVFNFPIGHAERNWPIIHGAKVRLSVEQHQSIIAYV